MPGLIRKIFGRRCRERSRSERTDGMQSRAVSALIEMYEENPAAYRKMAIERIEDLAELSTSIRQEARTRGAHELPILITQTSETERIARDYAKPLGRTTPPGTTQQIAAIRSLKDELRFMHDCRQAARDWRSTQTETAPRPDNGDNHGDAAVTNREQRARTAA